MGATYSFAVYLPNQTILPESQKGMDAGIELYASRWGSFQATYYNQTAGDLIDLVLVTPGDVPQYQSQNTGKIKNTGLELQGSVSLVRGLTLGGTYTITNSTVKQLAPGYTGDLQAGDQLLGIPRYVAGVAVGYTGWGWTANLGLLHSGSLTNTDYYALYDSYYKGAPFRASGRDYWITYPAFTKLRLSLSRQLGAGINAFVSAENLTNSYAYESANYIPPHGRTTTAGLDFRF
jgi:outer membrane receptor protein involved in Fe transport